jgi:cyclopropane fatty-acyl-phospholipid synthase-like methyltransferase
MALLQALRRRGLEHEVLHAFDLTPAMLDRFRRDLARLDIPRVEVSESDVRELERLPPAWTNYDLIVSVAMLEYVPRAELVGALESLRLRLAPQGRFLLFITRRNWITRLLIEKMWQANRYGRDELQQAFAAAGFGSPTFRRFPYSYFWQNFWAHVLEAPSAA